MRIDAGFPGPIPNDDGLTFPFETITLGTFPSTGCNGEVSSTTLTQSGGCQAVTGPFESIQAQIHENNCTLQLFSDSGCTTFAATVTLDQDFQCISEATISNTFTNATNAKICCDSSCAY